ADLLKVSDIAQWAVPLAESRRCASLSKTNNVKEPVKSSRPQPENLTAKPPHSREAVRLKERGF
ncbi:hypothetical protein, partial [Oceanicaulis sp. HTCC2633]|uniref:hypothetical protein n=1 Tax=Oceanicaulis sp. HTCC2633 TaxID=314254 RepID=UPI0019D70D3A